MVSLVLLVPRAEQRMHNCNKEDLLISLVQQYLKQILQGVPWAVFKDVFARSQASPKHGAYALAIGNGHLASGGGRSPLRAYVGSIPRTGLGSSKGDGALHYA